VDPLAERPRSQGDTDEPDPDVGLVDLVDQALVRLDGLRDRPRLSSAVTALLVFTLAVGWGLTRWRSVEPIDDRIPRVDDMVAADVAPVDPEGNGGSAELAEPAGPSGAGDPAVASDDLSAPAPPSLLPPTSTDPEVRLVVHVSGAVVTEGLVELADGARLADAITAAGGPTATADVHRLNLATPLVDGMHIRVPEAGEEGAAATRPLIETAETRVVTGGNDDGRPGADDQRIDVNQADVTELQRLPGIGPAIAAAIVAWRDDNGPFDSVDDLLDVPGIGPAKLAAIEDQVAV